MTFAQPPSSDAQAQHWRPFRQLRRQAKILQQQRRQWEGVAAGRVQMLPQQIERPGRSSAPIPTRPFGDLRENIILRNELVSFKSIAVFVDPSPSGEARARYAVKLAARQGAHLIGIFVVPDVWAGSPAESFARGHAAISALIERHAREEEQAVAAADRSFEKAGSRERIGYEFHVVRQEDAREAMLRAMHMDLVVVGQSDPSGLPVGWTAETLLSRTGVPFLIVPAHWRPDAVAERIVIGWNASRQARRAITDALPLLTTAQAVHVVVVDADRNQRHGEEPGADIALHLSRHGVRVTVDAVASESLPVAAALLRKAVLFDADLIVLGAYSHSRVGETVFGGVTRDMLNASPLPLLIAH